jgi:hypothetical protein
VILELQDELRCLERKLIETEEMDVKNGNGKRLMSRNRDLQQARPLRLLRGVKVPESPQGFFNPVNVRPNQGEKTPPSR